MDGIISEGTFKYLSDLPKKDRLSSVGMLASKKTEYVFKNGEPVSCEDKTSEYAGFFFYAAKRTFEIMQELKVILDNNYLFTWVDCIYFKPSEEAMSEAMIYLDSIGFPHSPEVLTRIYR